MSFKCSSRRTWRGAFAALLLAACSADMESAQRLISDIDARISTASTEAAKYVPEQVDQVRESFAALKKAFYRSDYSSVLRDGPSVLNAAQALDGATAAKKNAVLRSLNEEWSGLAAVLPDNVALLQTRLDLMARKAGRKLPGVDLEGASAILSSDASLWSKAQAAFATGNMEEAVSIGKALEARLTELAALLKIDLPGPPAA